MLTLEFLIEALTPPSAPPPMHGGGSGRGSRPITDVVIDSRRAGPGALFVALPGEQADGHQYVAQALEKGAVAAVIDQNIEVSCPVIDLTTAGARTIVSLQTPLCLKVASALPALQEAARRWHRHWAGLPGRRTIGITGSVGKSTTKEVIADVLAKHFSTLRNEGSYNNEIGLPMTALKLRSDHERAVLEMGFYVPGEIDLLTGIAPPQVGVVTLIAPVHLERAGSIDTIIRGKAELLQALPADGTAILNLDDDNVMAMATFTQARVLTYGLSPKADVWADQIEGLGLDGARCVLHHEGESRPVHLKMLGRHSVYTALAAAATGLVEGMSWEEIVDGLESTAGKLRLVAVPGLRGSTILDDTYNASPPSMIAALDLLADVPDERRIAVLGDMLELGEYEEEGHRRVGQRAAAVADVLVTVGERGRIIAREARHNGMSPSRVHIASTAQEAIEFLQSIIRPGNAVLVKGSRAVKMEQIVAALREVESSGGNNDQNSCA
ncbi:MAG: UDP-N-acetylmuramoyl-tripeptide--D-alanyl-D-alanine ligase [Anaerolineae bacterium]|nr:UDP-N-acetylmuramoyl-tripeptide--D-alanyl-D-alanine ligase [Anaerolineae bacterium]